MLCRQSAGRPPFFEKASQQKERGPATSTFSRDVSHASYILVSHGRPLTCSCFLLVAHCFLAETGERCFWSILYATPRNGYTGSVLKSVNRMTLLFTLLAQSRQGSTSRAISKTFKGRGRIAPSPLSSRQRLVGAAFEVSGSATKNVEPCPSADSSQMRPPCCSTSSRQR